MTDLFKRGDVDYIDKFNQLATAAEIANVEASKIAAEAAAAAAAASEASALTHKNSANSSATSAATASSTATTQAGVATTQATIATTKATEAANSASSALASSNTATTKASEASASAASAASSLASVNNIFDTFDDRFLGTKASDPTVDNDGNPLQAGAVYFNSVTSSVKFYNGVSWEAPAASATASATAAANSAATATTQANTATTKATEAANSAATALTSANTATTKANEASTSATSAASSATTATTQANTATSQATIATTKATEASTSASTASTKATEASNSATSASGSASTATTKAAQAVQAYNDSIAIYGSLAAVNDAKTAAEAAATSATGSASTATSQASIATSKALDASNYSDAALLQAGIATTKASEAATSATSASTSATTATTKAGEASTSATSASNSAATATTKAAEAVAAAASIEGFDLTIGTVVEGPAAASITGTVPNRVLNLTIPKGETGASGSDVSVSNEGTQITSAVTSINFVGNNIEATATGGAVTLTSDLTSPKINTALGYTPYSNAGGTVTGTVAISNASPTLQLNETDQTLPAGRYRFIVEGNILYCQQNTAAAGDYSTSTLVWGTDVSGAMYTASPGISSNNTRVATTNYVVNRIAQDALLKTGGTVTGNITVSTTAPRYQFDETDQTNGAGKYRLLVEGNRAYLQKNTAVAGDYSTATDVWSTDTSGNFIVSTNLGIGSVSTANNLNISKNVTGGATAQSFSTNSLIQSDVTSAAHGVNSQLGTAAATFNLGLLAQFRASQPTFGAGSTVTTQAGYLATSLINGAQNNYAFWGQIATGGNNNYNLYMSGSAPNYLAGSLGIGSVPVAGTNLYLYKGMTGAASAYGINHISSIQSDVTTEAVGSLSSIGTQAASFTLPSLVHFRVNQGAIGAGSVVTNQIGYQVASNLIGATNNYGFSSLIPAASGNWNLFMGGTAKNHMAGNLLLGSQTDTGEKLQVTGDAKVSGNVAATQFNGSGAGLTSIPNAALNNNSVTLGTTAVSLGGTISGIYGLTGLSLGTTDTNTLVSVANISSTTARYPSVQVQNFTGGFGGNPAIELKTARGTSAAPASVQTGDVLGGFNTWGHNGTVGVSATRIDGVAEATFSTSVSAGLSFKTTLAGTQAQKMYLTAEGKLLVNTTNNGVDQLQVGGTASILANSSTAALVVTQTGSGHALLVQDEAADSTSFVVGATGNVGIGGTSFSDTKFRVTGALPSSGNNSVSAYLDGTVSATSTNSYSGIVSVPTTESSATPYTTSFLRHFLASGINVGTNSTVTNQYGFLAESGLTGATNNYGFFGNLAASGTSRWNLYMGGSAPNYLAGSLGVGVVPNAFGGVVNVAGGSTPIVAVSANANDSTGTLLRFHKNRNTNVYANTVVANGDALGTIGFLGANGTDYSNAASIQAIVDGVPGVANMPGRLVFNTTPAGSTASIERMRINSAGNVLIGGITDTGEKLQVTGNAKVLGNISLSSGAPILEWTETDQTLPAGKFRILSQAGNLSCQINTAVSGDYSTTITGWQVNTFGELVTTTPATSANSTVVATTAYVVNRIAQDAASKGANTFTGVQSFLGTRTAKVDLATNIDLTLGDFFKKTISGATTLTISGVAAGGITSSFILDLTNGGSATITWWTSIKWAGGTAPTLTAAGRDVLGFFTHDNGTTWTGLVLGKDVK